MRGVGDASPMDGWGTLLHRVVRMRSDTPLASITARPPSSERQPIEGSGEQHGGEFTSIHLQMRETRVKSAVRVS